MLKSHSSKFRDFDRPELFEHAPSCLEPDHLFRLLVKNFLRTQILVQGNYETKKVANNQQKNNVNKLTGKK